MPALDLSKPSDKQSQLSIFLGITVWFLHLNIVNALISIACKWGGLTAPVGALTWLQILSAIITLVAVLVMLFLIFLGWRNWQNFQTASPSRNPDMLHDTEEYRRPLMAFIAMALNGFLILYAIATFVPVFSLKACGQA